MQEKYIQDESFHTLDFTVDPLAGGAYEGCTFHQCNFAGGDLSGFQFIDCVFFDCNLSLVQLKGTVLRDIKFRDCKMLGLRFDTCHEFGLSFSFEGCVLHHSSFYKRSIKKTVFKNCQLQDTDFTEADLTASVFDHCDLSQALFDHTLLERADLSTAQGYSINPETNRIKKAKFSLFGLPGLLHRYEITIVQ